MTSGVDSPKDQLVCEASFDYWVFPPPPPPFEQKSPTRRVAFQLEEVPRLRVSLAGLGCFSIRGTEFAVEPSKPHPLRDVTVCNMFQTSD